VVPAELPPDVHDAVKADVLGSLWVDERRAHDGAGVDVRVVRDGRADLHRLGLGDAALFDQLSALDKVDVVVALVQRQGVEGASRGLDADVLVDFFGPVQGLRDRIRDDLGAGLHAERDADVADGEALAVDRADGDAVLFGVDFGELCRGEQRQPACSKKKVCSKKVLVGSSDREEGGG
jgi:hypothetical protein